ncbi:hypothetical protein L3X38_036918 [Prunus dulcis]|uniref:BED-type domain-containing protein n=1 Tax=Prunus dulcis TaxID=3755 RepID=A0AAD4YPW8_PRUDU|nr:hypothetical protein L3X38_036918 [Prunus dulcis]
MSSGVVKRDPAWEHGDPIDGNKNGSICKYCGRVMKSGGVTRLKYHLSGLDPGNNVQRCDSVPPEVKAFITTLLKNKQHQKEKKTHGMENIRAGLRGEVIGQAVDSDDDDDEDEYDDDMGPEERRNFKRPLRASKQSAWEREHLHKLPNRAQVSGTSGGAQMRRGASVRESQPTPPMAPSLYKSSRARQKSVWSYFAGGNVKEGKGCLISKFFINDNVPAEKASSHHFKNMVLGCQQASVGVQPPTPYEVRNKYLKMEYKDISEYVNKLRSKWETNGCTIMCDGWAGPTRLSIINFMVHSKGKTICLKSVDASDHIKNYKYIYKLLRDVIMEVGEHNVVQVVTNNGSAFVKAGKKLMKHHNVFWTSCAAHCIDLMFEAMGKRENISNVIKRARTITNYIYNHGWLLAKMREFCKGEIIRLATTRFATNYIALDSLLKKKSGLKQLFTSEDWANHNFSRSNAGRMVESIVLDHSFWTQSEHVCQVFEPLYKVLRIVDTEVYPTMGAIYELMRVVKEELEKKTWCKVAYYLNPRYQYRPGVGDDGTLIRAVHKVYSKLDPASPAVGQFGNELTWFKDARRTFGEPTSVAARTKMSPTEWWIMYGTDAPTVRKLAIKVLSQTTSSSACERNWSTFALIHTKQRNRLAHSRLEKLVYCYYNMKLQIRDKEAEIDHVDRGDPLDVFDIAAEDDDTEGNQLYQWIRPLHLDDDEGNPSPRVAEEARNEGINVERVLEEEVGSSSADSLEELLSPRPRNKGIPPSSNPTQPQDLADINDSSSTRSGDSPTTGGGNDEGYSGAGGSGGYGNYVGPSPEFMSPFTGEANFTHATQDEDHGSRQVGPGIGAIGKDYTRRERGKEILSSQEDDSLSITSDSVGVGSSNYDYTHNQPFPYPSYLIPLGKESSSSWKESETQSSNDFAHGQRQPISDPYGWHVNNYMQNYFGDLSFDDYSSQYTYSTHRDDEDSESFEPHRNSMWY